VSDDARSVADRSAERDTTGPGRGVTAEPASAAAVPQSTVAAIDSISEGFIILDRDWRFVFVNPAAERFMRRPRADVSGRSLWECFPDAASRRFGVEYRRAVAENTRVEFEEFYPEPLNAWFEVRAYPSSDGLSIFFRDVTERRTADEALRRSEERYRALFNSMTEGFALHEIVCKDGVPCDYRFLDVNPAFEALTGLAREQVVGRLMTEVLPGEDPHWVQTYGAVALTGESIRFEHDSRVLSRHYQVFAFRPAPRQFAVLFHDITEHRQLEEALRVNLTKYSVLFESFPLGISVTDAEGAVREINRRASHLLGTTPDAVLSHHIGAPQWRIIRPDGSPMPPEEFASVRAMQEQGVVEDVETGIARPGEDVIWVSVTAAPIPLDGYGVVIAYGDISRRRKAESLLEAANAELRRNNETLEARVAERTADLARRASQIEALALDRTRAEERERQKIARVIHDHLQQLLSLARINLGIALGQVTGRSVRASLRELDGLIAESLDITRSITSDLSPGIVHRGTLGTALRWLGRWFENRFGLEVAVDAGEDVDVAEDVRVTLFRAARELLFNVVKHAHVTAASLRVSVTGDGRVQITVRDEGVGFDPAILRAWDGARGSFGLLSLREHLDLFGGRLEVESAPRRGTTVTIVGPVARPAEIESAGGASGPARAAADRPPARPHPKRPARRSTR
jgi:PAS domain S-box-containing protein